MAFTGIPVVKAISDRMVRITGLSLAGSASGEIILHGSAIDPFGKIVLPVTFQPTVYAYGNPGSEVALVDSVKIEMLPVNTVASFLALDTNKTGTATADFAITVHNSSGSASPELEMYVSFHD